MGLLLALAPIPAISQANSPRPDPKAVPVIDGGIGPCSADFTVVVGDTVFVEELPGDRAGEAFDDPANTCKAQFTITLHQQQSD